MRPFPRRLTDTNMKSWSGNDIAPRRRIPKHNILAATVFVVVICAPALLINSGYLFLDVFDWTSGSEDESTALKTKEFQWDSIQATEDFQFHPCFDGFECAKLKLSLDYFNGTYPNSSISLALAKLPAKVPVDDPRYGGPILINPGGPGGSGVKMALSSAYMLQVFADSAEDINSFDSSAKYFDIIGFDPRGIGETEPASLCLPDGPSRWSWRLRQATEGILGSSDAALGRLWAMEHAYGASCKQYGEADNSMPDIKQYMTTASVARDMLEVAERHSEYVTAKRSELTTHLKNSTKLQYFGFSYGTYLGYTFASMFPDRVGRFILDGVVNSYDYNLSLGNGSLHDAEKAMASFYTFCLQAGAEMCPLATPNSSVQSLEDRVQNILKSLYHDPLPVWSENGPEIITYSDVKSILFYSLYSPVVAFPIIAQILNALERGEGEALDNWAAGLRGAHVYQCALDTAIADPLDAEVAILCSDGEDVSSHDIQTFEDYWHVLASTSPTSGSIWSMLRLSCNSWKIRAVHRYTGTFGANTSNPILFISNTADPVTPMKSGRIMHAKFPGSGFLVQDSAGHCSLSTATPCTIKHIRNYFQHGKLPATGTVCEPPPSPFLLNSTDPGSPFYEPELGGESPILEGATFTAHDPKDEDAAKRMERWFAEEMPLWPTRDTKSVRALLAAGLQDYRMD